MKKCPFCAEEIQDEAVRCRFCGSDLTAPTPVAAAPPVAPDPDRPVSLSYMGPGYALGTGADYFGIWSARAAGPPVERFERTDAGWSQAWERFRQLEPAGTPLTTSAVPGSGPPPGPSSLPSGPMLGATQQTNGAAVASLVLGIVGVVLGFVPFLGLILGVLAIVFAYVGFKRAEATASGRGLAIAGLVLGIVATIFGILFVAVFSKVAEQVEVITDELDQLPTFGP